MGQDSGRKSAGVRAWDGGDASAVSRHRLRDDPPRGGAPAATGPDRQETGKQEMGKRETGQQETGQQEGGGHDTAQHGPARHGTDRHGIGKRILVVEDEPNIAEAIRFLLRRDGWEVAVHPEGAGALQAIATAPPDLVILDVMLPGVSGLDILRRLRAAPATEALPVMVLTARGQSSAREMAYAAGASLFMAKPFGNAELLAAVRQLVGV